jgi:futalosine hydrolase
MLLLLAATPLETRLLRPRLPHPPPRKLGGYSLFSGALCRQQVLLAHTGIGQVVMAMQLTRLLEQQKCSAAILFGCGGGYPASGLKTGELALAEAEVFGDLGVATADGFTPLEQLAIPEREELAPRCQQIFPLSPRLLDWARQILPEARCGTFVTVNCCSGTSLLSEQLAQRTGGICENMEGAAAAQVCAEFKLPLLEIRGISNPTGTHDPQDWDIRRGAEVAQQAVLTLLEHWPPGEWT